MADDAMRHYLIFGMYHDGAGQVCIANTTFSCPGFPEHRFLLIAFYKKLVEQKIDIRRGTLRITGLTPLSNREEALAWSKSMDTTDDLVHQILLSEVEKSGDPPGKKRKTHQ